MVSFPRAGGIASFAEMAAKSSEQQKQKPDQAVIKQMLALRAKYKVTCASGYLQCFSLVSHPSNRGGEPIRAERTKTLAGDICEGGFNPTTASSDAVTIMARRDENDSTKIDPWFTTHFKNGAAKDPDMFFDANKLMENGTCSHGTLNLLHRNILQGMPGCVCKPATVGVNCKCMAKPILDEATGRYSMDKLKKHDAAWHTYIVSGNEWEILHWKIDVEEPDAAHIICAGLNKPNDAALKIAHLEMFRTLVHLCEPGPGLEVQFEPVLYKLRNMFGRDMDSPDWAKAFEVVMVGGGKDSPLFKEYLDWAGHFVNEQYRTFKTESYSVLAEYGVEFAKVGIMQMRYIWFHKVNKDSLMCITPVSLYHRMCSDSKTSWPTLMRAIENTGCNLLDFSTAVLRRNPNMTPDQVSTEALRWSGGL